MNYLLEDENKRFKLDVNYATPRSTPFNAERTQPPFTNTPVSFAGDTLTLGNLPIHNAAVPDRVFVGYVEKAKKMCTGTTIFKCRSGGIAETTKECKTCRDDIKGLKNTICKNWNNYKNDLVKQDSNRVQLMKRHNDLIKKFDGFLRVDFKEAIGRICEWRPKMDGMPALWFKDAVREEVIEDEVQIEEEDQTENIAPSETVIRDFYGMAKDICFICQRDVGMCPGRYCQCGIKFQKDSPDVCNCGRSTVGVGRVCESCFLRLKALPAISDLTFSKMKKKPLAPRAEKFKFLNEFDKMDEKNCGPRLFVCTLTRRSSAGRPRVEKREVNGVWENFTQHDLVWEMLGRKKRMAGRYSGNRVDVERG